MPTYIPILKGKQGEFWAIRDLDDADKQQLLPVIEIPPIPWDYENETEARSIDDHLAKLPENLQQAWGIESSIAIDMPSGMLELNMQDGRSPITYIYEECRAANINIEPTVCLGHPIAHINAARDVIRDGAPGVCLRIQVDDFESDDIAQDIADLLETLQISEEQVDLILDFKSIEAGNHSVFAMAVRGSMSMIPNMNDWRTLALASTAFPQNLSGIESNMISEITRSDWLLWKGIHDKPGSLRIPVYSDYGISHPEIPDLDPRIMRASASIRYTTEDKWLIVKGRGVRMAGYDQFRQLCRALVAREEYDRPEFSAGDRFISECASGEGGVGNLTTWRRVGTNHHVKRVLHQIANLP